MPWVATLRAKHLLAYAEKEDPERPAEYRHKAALTEPAGASDALKASLALKNAEITNGNARFDESWAEHKRDSNDEIAALLQTSLMPRAKLRWERLAEKHKQAMPHEHMVNGGKIWRELVALSRARSRRS